MTLTSFIYSFGIEFCLPVPNSLFLTNMPNVRKGKALPESSEGEDFGDNFNNDFSNDSSESDSIEVVEDTWRPIVVERGAKHDDYEKVNDPLLKNE